MKYTINIDNIFYFEGAQVTVEATEEECTSSLKCVEKIYTELGKMMMQSMMPTSSTSSCTCTCSQQQESSDSFKEVEKEEPKTATPVTKKPAKKEKEKDDEDEYI